MAAKPTQDEVNIALLGASRVTLETLRNLIDPDVELQPGMIERLDSTIAMVAGTAVAITDGAGEAEAG